MLGASVDLELGQLVAAQAVLGQLVAERVQHRRRVGRHRLAGLAMRILRDFARLASGEGGNGVGAQARDEINARAPLAVDALKALARFSDDLFAEKVEEAFPALTALVRCEHVPAEVTRVLGEVFTAKIGPLVIGSLGKS